MALAAPGFFEFLREITRRHGIVLVCDEVIAFRVGSQGRRDATASLRTSPHSGRSSVVACPWRRRRPRGHPGSTGSGRRAGRVISGGTYSGNPLSAVAGAATLGKLTPAAFARLDLLGHLLRSGINDIFRSSGVKAQASGDGSLFQIVPTDRPIVDYRSVPRDPAAVAWLDRLHLELLAQGVIISNRGLACLSTAMDEAVVARSCRHFRSQ
jgi:glutamate-1-semialdehyde 2,1-aminomutase